MLPNDPLPDASATGRGRDRETSAPPAGSKLRIGCSSWTSEAWVGRVYPEGLPDADRLAWYARFWDSVEVDATYYRAPSADLVRRWARVSPPGFCFTLKFPRELLDPRRALRTERIAAFLETVTLLGPKLGAVLLQFPPWFKPGRASPFLDELLGRLEPRVRYSVELRDAGWFSGEIFERLQRSLSERRVALAWSYLTYVDVPPAVTSDFVYLRFIGDHTSVPAVTHGEVRVDRTEAVDRWATRLRDRLKGLAAAFVFFNNHFAGFAPASLNDFRRARGLPPIAYAPQRRTLDG